MADFTPDRDYCPNCQNELIGRFCYSCGQNQKGFDRFFWSILNELFDDVFSKRSKVFLTLFYLLFRPGFLTVEYFSGRRARYFQPLKLYIFTSLIFFTLLSISNYFATPPVAMPVINADTEDISVNSDKNKQQADIEKLEESLKDSNISFLSNEENELFRKKLLTKITGFTEDAAASSKSFISEFIEAAPFGLLLLVPVFAFVLKLFYLSSGLYYTQHLILAVYNHSFLFLALSLNIALGLLESVALTVSQLLTTVLELWTIFYIFRSLMVAYKQSISVTVIKFLFLGSIYCMLFFFILLLLFLWNLLI